MTDSIRFSVADGVADIVIDRPDKRNALTSVMYTGLAEAFAAATDDPAVRAVLLYGSGGIFTAGNDLRDFLDNPPTSPEDPVWQFLAELVRTTKPIVAAVGGWAVGIGTTVLLHCDLVVAADDARFQMPFVDLALTPEAASTLLLPRMAGYHRAAELLLLGGRFGAEEAREAGLVNRVVPADEVEPTARGLAAELAAKPAAAVQLTKALLRSPPEEITARIDREREVFTGRLSSPEAVAAFEAFLAPKR